MTRTALLAGDRPAMPDSPTETPRSPARRRLLLVDDNAEGRRALARLLGFHGFDVTAVGDGASALHALRQSPPPEIVLTDLLLPDLDGREVALLAHALDPVPTVVMITGWDFGPEVPDPATSGIDHIFLKPLNVAELVATLDRCA